MSNNNGSKKNWNSAAAWAAFGIAIGAGVALYIATKTKDGESKLTETLEDLFKICETDCNLLESQIGSARAS